MDLGALFTTEATRPLVVSDIDNTLAYQAQAECTAVNSRFGTSYLTTMMATFPTANLFEPEQRQWLTAVKHRDPWLLNLAPDREAIGALRLIRSGGHRVVVSSDRHPAEAATTVRWLDANNVPRNDQVLNGPGSKRAVLAANGPANPGILIDDAPEKWLTIARPGVEVWCPRRPWTPPSWRQYPNVHVFDDWAEVLGRLGIS